jgi:hypothetical protein
MLRSGSFGVGELTSIDGSGPCVEAWKTVANHCHRRREGAARPIPELRGPRFEGVHTTRVAARWGAGFGWILGRSRFGCGGDSLQSCQVPAQGRASWLGKGDPPPRAGIRPNTGNLDVPGFSER